MNGEGEEVKGMRWKCQVAYDGTEFEGWQSQPGGKTIQDFIERRLRVLFRQDVRIHGSGRTDSGVHAEGQVFHFDGEWRHGPEALVKALRTGYPDSIQVYAAEVVDDDFHARFSATGKCYVYRFYEGYAPPFETRYAWSIGNWILDTDAMNRAAGYLTGHHDFSAFSANSRDEREENPVKNMWQLEVVREGPRVTLTTQASGYLYRMVRSLAGCLMDVGIGKLSPEDMKDILESRTRTNRVVTAPAQGLTLKEVFYGQR